MNYLIVDDSKCMRKIMKKYLEEAQLSMHKSHFFEACDGNEAIEKVNEIYHNFPLENLILMLNVNMPNVGGLEALKEIRRDRRCGLTPIIMTSAYSHKSVIIESIKAGANNFLVKPFTKDELISKVNQYVDNY